MGETLTAAGIVLFNPDLFRLQENIDSIVNDVKTIYCFDNHSTNIKEIECFLQKYTNIILLKASQNHGIAYALNRIIENASLNKIDWILTLDQDSVCQEGMLKRMQSQTSDPQVGIICPFILERGASHNAYSKLPSVQYVDKCITSASLIRIDAWKKANGFEEYLFMDYADFQFDACVRKCGYKILRCNDVFLLQTIGSMKEKVLFFHHFHVRDYPPIRYYYKSRNLVYCKYAYPWLFTSKLYLSTQIQEIFKLFFLNNNPGKSQKISCFINGYFDGIKKVKSEKYGSKTSRALG